MNIFTPKFSSSYRYIFILDSANEFALFEGQYKSELDLMLTYDFGLYHHVTSLGGDVFFIDHMVNSKEMDKNNFIVHDFFQKWNLDSKGNDIFSYKTIPFGFSFRIDIWNKLVYTSKLYLCLSVLKTIQHEKIYLASQDDSIVPVLKNLELSFSSLERTVEKRAKYFFPIDKYLADRLQAKGIRGFLYKTRFIITAFYGLFMMLFDFLCFCKDKKTIFIQEYHPTKTIISTLKKYKNLRVLLVNFSRGSSFGQKIKERLLPIYGRLSSYDITSKKLMKEFDSKKHQKLILTNDLDITNSIYTIIEACVERAINEKLRVLDCSINYLSRHNVDLEILIANIGLVPTVFDCVCKQKGISSYLIINGLLGSEFGDEGKYATVINSYSSSIRDNYFKGMDNIVVLGDPRMDAYPQLSDNREINRDAPVVVIGASGFSPVDLNSYVAIEFDFMFDVLSGIKILKENGVDSTVIIKVRPNGYKSQYANFVDEFFPDLVDDIIDTKPMKDVFKSCDLYVSISSQTLFEASCLGIPVIYYKKDCEVMSPPFDGDSELITANNISDFVNEFIEFQNSSPKFEKFLDREVMEKYIGHLDGKNLERNISYINSLIDNKNAKTY